MLNVQIKRKITTKAFVALVAFINEAIDAKPDLTLHELYELIKVYMQNKNMSTLYHTLLYQSFGKAWIVSLHYGNDGCPHVYIKADK